MAYKIERNTWTKFKGKPKTNVWWIYSEPWCEISEWVANEKKNGNPHDTKGKQALQRFNTIIELKIQRDVLLCTISQISFLSHHDLEILPEMYNLS